MKRILVPCDFSIRSLEAYVLAMNWAAKSEGEVILLYVAYVPFISDAGVVGAPIGLDSRYFETMEEYAAKKFVEFKKTQGLPDVASSIVVTMGDILYEIRTAIGKYNIDMVVMGTNGTSGLEELLIGSNTEKVVRHVDVPVLAVRKSMPLSSLKKIVLPTTLGLNQTDFMAKLKELQAFLGATVHVLFINTATRFMRHREGIEALEEFARHYQLANYELHFETYYNEEEGIMDFSRHHKAGVIAMGTHARKGLAHLFNGSITEDIVNHVDGTIWTYKLKKE
jgi:nucleotide-binding universal stress UspA family protein